MKCVRFNLAVLAHCFKCWLNQYDHISVLNHYYGGRVYIRTGNTGVLGSKTRVLVTHQVQFAPLADTIVVMNNGVITHVGTYTQLLAAGVDFAAIVQSNDTSQHSAAQAGAGGKADTDGAEVTGVVAGVATSVMSDEAKRDPIVIPPSPMPGVHEPAAAAGRSSEDGEAEFGDSEDASKMPSWRRACLGEAERRARSAHGMITYTNSLLQHRQQMLEQKQQDKQSSSGGTVTDDQQQEETTAKGAISRDVYICLLYTSPSPRD